jgi:hypothetical protein
MIYGTQFTTQNVYFTISMFHVCILSELHFIIKDYCTPLDRLTFSI